MAETDPSRTLARLRFVAFLALAVAAVATAVAVYALVRTPAAARSIELSIDGKRRVTLDADGLIFQDDTGIERAALTIQGDRSVLRLEPASGGQAAALSSSAAMSGLDLGASGHAAVTLLAAAHTASVGVQTDQSTADVSVTSAPDLASAKLDLDVPGASGAAQRAMIGINNASGPSVELIHMIGGKLARAALQIPLVDGMGPLLELTDDDREIKATVWRDHPGIELWRQSESFWSTPSPPAAKSK